MTDLFKCAVRRGGVLVSRAVLAAGPPSARQRPYPNFPDADLDGWAQAYKGTNHARLRQIKRRYDPGNLFWARQGLHPDHERSHAHDRTPIE